MANAKGSANDRDMIQTGKNLLLPPKSPFPVPSSSYADYGMNPSTGSKAIPKSKEGNAYHHRTSSESLLLEEQPSWLDDLLNEPETPVRRGHRRSSSDSFAYLDMASMTNTDYVPLLPDERKYNMGSAQLWEFQNFDPYKDVHQGTCSIDPNTYANLRNKTWELPLSSGGHLGGMSFLRDHPIPQGAGSSLVPQGKDRASHTVAEKQDNGESDLHETQAFPEQKDPSHGKMASVNDKKRAKQKFAQRSRVRKLEYIAELERNVQALQAKGSEVSSELEFVNQQHLILSMENKALKQRLESLTQEQLIKYLEHEVLEREISRLRALCQQQQQQSEQPPQQQLPHQRQSSSAHRRANSKDLDSQFASFSLKHKQAGSDTDPVSGSVHI